MDTRLPMSTTAVIFILIAVMCITSRSTAKPVVINADHPEQECVHKLGQNLDTCLQQFNSQLSFYKDLLTTADQRMTMQASLCQDYQEALMCVHQELVKCEDSRNHLDTVQKRLGAVREFMIHVCAAASRSDTDTARKSGPATPSTTSITMETTTSTTTTVEKPTTTTHKTTSSSSTPKNLHRVNSVSGKTLRQTVASPNDLPSGGQTSTHHKSDSVFSASPRKTPKTTVSNILDCLKNKRNNISACVEYYFQDTNSAHSTKSISLLTGLVLVASVLLL